MRFHNFLSLWDDAKKHESDVSRSWIAVGRNEFYRRAASVFRQRGMLFESNFAVFESKWWEDSRPYYKVFPCIMRSMEKVKLDIRCNEVPNPPFESMVMRYADGSIFSTVFFNLCSHKEWPEGHRQISVSAFEADKCRKSNLSLGIALLPGTTVEEGIRRANVEIESDAVKKVHVALRHALMICLLSNDPSIITPDVLSADRDRYNSETDEAWKQRAVDRARRRGVVGWNIGADYEVCPHYRRPHFGLRYTGKGGTIPRIVPIKGAVVHRSKLTEVPTGYMLPDGTEVEK